MYIYFTEQYVLPSPLLKLEDTSYEEALLDRLFPDGFMYIYFTEQYVLTSSHLKLEDNI